MSKDFEIVTPQEFIPAVHPEHYGRMSFEGRASFGARLTAATRCAVCDKPFQAGDEVVADLKEDWDEAPWHHKGCHPSPPKPTGHRGFGVGLREEQP